MRLHACIPVLAVAILAVCAAEAQEATPSPEAVTVTFQLNDAYVKDKVLAGVAVVIAREDPAQPIFEGETDDLGRLAVTLPLGAYLASYSKSGYVPIGSSPIEVRGDGQLITTTLSMMLEAEGSAAERRVRIILNWGSDESHVRDADSHVICPCGVSPDHVYYVEKAHDGLGHTVELDVDDVDWGGPETITLSDPLPGTYVYWVHDFSGPPAVLGRSDVVVRVLFGDTVAAEVHVPDELTDRVWRPFKAVVVEPDLRPRIVRFTAEELAAGADRIEPPGYETDSSDDTLSFTCGLAFFALIFSIIGLFVLFAILRRR